MRGGMTCVGFEVPNGSRRLLNTLLAAPLVLLWLWPACAATGAEASQPAVVVVEEAWIIPAASSSRATALLVINNPTQRDWTLLSVDSANSEQEVIMTRSGLVMATGAVIPIHSELYMTPDGMRVVLIDLKRNFEPGAKEPLTLRFADDLVATVDARVLDAGSVPPDHHDFVH
jgi:copper(I)-binding protein